MNFEIVTDSSANLPQGFIESQNIHILSLSYFLNEIEYKSYEKGRDNDKNIVSFYEELRKKGNARTSLVNTQDARETLEQLMKNGKDVLYIGFSSGLSGTYQSVSIAAEDVSEAYPNVKCRCIDTLAATLGQGILVYYAAKMRENGNTLDETAEWLENNKLRVQHWFTVDDLFYLHRGGRLSTASAIFGSALNIKPLLSVDANGKLFTVDKVRGRKKVLNQIIARFIENVENPDEQIIGISHGDCEEDALYLKKKVLEHCSVKDVWIENMEPVIGTHTGPGVIAFFFIGKPRT